MDKRLEEKKPIIMEIDNVRIRKWDESNYFIERLETYWNPKEKKETTDYKFKGYYSTVSACLKAISSKGLLVEEKDVSDLESHLKEVEQSNAKLMKALEG
ncbi:hypothetical protein OPHB3_1946 [Oceanobacillus picturae]|uniref:Uncharacterized protein n=1 Tax=Oceanobacillus picturae TaxID=171693 RepID=A0A0U9H5L9_9BACI|nr:hypothetical protein [Oceanobacillus picturae]GAQ18007.1 hypothetical protein OPHB3_1946 [Oceanobacillus picturae]